jgi:hypothetical protein
VKLLKDRGVVARKLDKLENQLRLMTEHGRKGRFWIQKQKMLIKVGQYLHDVK